MARSSQPVVADADDLQRFIEQHDITTFKAGAVDIDGVWRGKRIAAPYFADAVWRKGTNICNILFGWDLHDVPIPGLTYTGWQTAYPDVVLVPDLSTLAVVPWEPGTASVICDVHELDGAPLPLSPRALLRRVAEQATVEGGDDDHASRQAAVRKRDGIGEWNHGEPAERLASGTGACP